MLATKVRKERKEGGDDGRGPAWQTAKRARCFSLFLIFALSYFLGFVFSRPFSVCPFSLVNAFAEPPLREKKIAPAHGNTWFLRAATRYHAVPSKRKIVRTAGNWERRYAYIDCRDCNFSVMGGEVWANRFSIFPSFERKFRPTFGLVFTKLILHQRSLRLNRCVI